MQPSNILKIESLDDNWCDKDFVMLHACFQLLKDCVEKENLLSGHIDWQADETYKQTKAEIEQLYYWWELRLKKEENSDITKPEYEEDNIMLHRLINIRWALWT